MINGMKIVESWTRGVSDYTDNNGEGTIYGVYVLENGDKFFTRGTLVAVQSTGVTNLTATTVGPITGGALDSREASPGPIYLQGSEKGRVAYRSIVLTPAVK